MHTPKISRILRCAGPIALFLAPVVVMASSSQAASIISWPFPTPTPRPSKTPKPTATPRPTGTPRASATPQPTATPRVTPTPQPTATPKPIATPKATTTPKPTAKPTATPVPTALSGTNAYPIPLKAQSNVFNSVEVPATNKVIALTFDDGPQPGNTEQILAILAQNNVKATFFQVGQHLADYPALGKSVRDAGHAIGNHTWSHQETPADPDDEVHHADATIQSVYGGPTGLFRPPFGDFDNGVVQSALAENDAVIVWSVDPQDWDMPGTDVIVNTVVSGATPGGIVLMHDGGGDRTQTIAALPTIISQLKAQGYKFVTIPELLALSLGDPTTTPPTTGSGDSPPLAITMTAPGADYSYQTLTATGTAQNARRGAKRPVKTVSATVKRLSDNLYWSGTAWGATATSLPATLSSGVWTLPLTSIGDGHFAISVSGVDKINNTTTLPIRNFWIDNVAPTTTITTPVTGTTYSVLATATGTAVDTGAGVSSVSTALMRSDGYWWTGAAWSSTYTEVKVAPSGTTWSYALPAFTNDTYVLWAKSSDYVGNLGAWVRSDFTIASISGTAARTAAGAAGAAVPSAHKS